MENDAPPGLQIYLRPRVTLTFDLLTPKVNRFIHARQLASKIGSFVFTSLVTDERMNARERRG